MNRRAFTLIELLVAITVIGILAAMTTAAVNASRRSARVEKTKYTVRLIHRLIAEKYDSYRTRRVPLSTAGMDMATAARCRLYGLRDIMRMEMPDRWSDVTGDPLAGVPVPSLTRRYRRMYEQAMLWAGGDPDKQLAVSHNAAAECLYMIVMAIPEAPDLFHISEIADTDGDGLDEFVDAWGRPIRFLRWAPGWTDSVLQECDGWHQHDPCDPLRIDEPTPAEKWRGCLLRPLIYSAGQDGVYDVNIGDGHTYNHLPEPSPDPYRATDTGTLIGEPVDDDGDGPDHYDNIHNHVLDMS